LRGRKEDTTHPMRRASDVWYIHSRENWYRDLWLFVISIVVAIAIIKAVSTSNKASDLAQAIQRQRVSQARDNCLDENARHKNTVDTLDGLIADLPAARRKQAEASRQFTVLLIDALAPVRDCDLVAKAVVNLP
jgi:hypothetical protein